MIDINSIKVIGFDETRPPLVRKENYIDLFFKLSVEPPADWCDDFNGLGHQIQPPAKINPQAKTIISTYVHDMQLLQKHLDKIKEKVSLCNENYVEKIRQKALALAAKQAETTGTNAKQNQLNEIVSRLIF